MLDKPSIVCWMFCLNTNVVDVVFLSIFKTTGLLFWRDAIAKNSLRINFNRNSCTWHIATLQKE